MRSTTLWVLLAACSAPVTSPDGGSGGGSPATGGGGTASTGGGSAAGGGLATGGSSAGGGVSTGGGSSSAGGGTATTLAAQYPGDVGIENDPDVVWVENFEEADVAAVRARYDDGANPGGLALVTDVPPGSHGAHSMRFTSGQANNATDLFKSFGSNGFDELYVRWYAKYQSGIQWHHSGVWIGGYNPQTAYAFPHAGLKPDGDDRFSIAFEPTEAATNARMDFYNYWMDMHSWMQTITNDGTSYYGNAVLHDPSVQATDDTWICLEMHVKVNPDPATKDGAVLELFYNDALKQRFDDAGPMGYWVADKFCPLAATGTECTSYPPTASTPRVTLDQRYRSVAALKLAHFWPQNYITSGPDGSLQLDDMVLARRRIGCLR